MTWVVVAAVLLAGVVVALLFVPVRLRMVLDTGAEPDRRLLWRVGWLGLTFGPESGRQRREPTEQPERRAPKKKKPKRQRPGRGGRWRAALRTPGLVRRVIRLVSELLAPLCPRALDAAVSIGLDDPGATGALFGQLYALAAAAPQTWQIRAHADFEGPAFEARARADWSVSPAVVIWPVATFLAAPVVWRAAHAAWRAPAGRRR